MTIVQLRSPGSFPIQCVTELCPSARPEGIELSNDICPVACFPKLREVPVDWSDVRIGKFDAPTETLMQSVIGIEPDHLQLWSLVSVSEQLLEGGVLGQRRFGPCRHRAESPDCSYHQLSASIHALRRIPDTIQRARNLLEDRFLLECDPDCLERPANKHRKNASPRARSLQVQTCPSRPLGTPI